jgi:hypothetical protein
MMAFLVCQTYTRGFRPGSLVPSYKAAAQRRDPIPRPSRSYRLAKSGADEE